MFKRLFDVDPWKLSLRGLPSEVRLMESLTSVANGYMGLRGNFEEGYSGGGLKGTYVAGVWHPDRTRVGWWKNGYPLYFGKMVNAVDFIKTGIAIDGVAVDLALADYSDFSLELDMRCGLLTRSYVYKGPGADVRLTFRRFLSIVEKRLAFMQVEAEVLRGAVEIELTPALDGNVFNEDSNYGESFWSVEAVEGRHPYGRLEMRTVANPFDVPQFTVTAVMHNRLDAASGVFFDCGEREVSEAFSFRLSAGEKAVLDKTVAVVTDRDDPAPQHTELAEALLADAASRSFEENLAAHTAAWEARWEQADVRILGDDEAQQGIRFNLFQLFCTWYGEDERLNIGPKGFTGEKYGGATYWDTEAYILPMYLSVAQPDVVRKLLLYRYNQLDGAFHNARQQGLDGALYPMVTFNGVECHNEWEITFEEIHRNGAIAWAIYAYTQYTGDESYLMLEGIEVLVAISRFWASRVHWSERAGQYMIHGVTGPNEYENNVSNNWYTNLLARWVLQYTLDTLEKLPPLRKKALSVSVKEQKQWRDIADNMYLPYDGERGVFVQHDTFLDKDLKPAAAIPEEERPLNQHWSWDRILRSCYIKQADVLQGIYFFGDQFTLSEKKRNFDFYEPMTVHESSLSASIHAILAAELGREEKAVELYARTARLDLDNYNNDTGDGLHITSMSGSWLAIVQGFAGMRTYGGTLSFAPFCPAGWQGYDFTVNWRGRVVYLHVGQAEVQATLRAGAPLTLRMYGEDLALTPGQTAAAPMRKGGSDEN